MSIHADSECADPALVTGGAAEFQSPGLAVSVADNSTTTFWARATDEAENSSDCSSASTTYTEDSQAPDTSIDSGPSGATNDPAPSFTFSSTEEPASFECRLDEASFAPCSSPLSTEALADGAHTFYARATDQAANTDPTPASRSFTVDTEAPGAPSSLGTDPASPANANEPLLSGEAESGSTVSIHADSECADPALVTGGAAEFQSPGLAVSVADNSTTTFWARATDEAENSSDCSSASTTYTEDSRPPTPRSTPAPRERPTTRPRASPSHRPRNRPASSAASMKPPSPPAARR